MVRTALLSSKGRWLAAALVLLDLGSGFALANDKDAKYALGGTYRPPGPRPQQWRCVLSDSV